MTFSGSDTSPTVDSCSFSICRTQSPEELGRVGERSLGWTDCRAATLTFFFNAYTEKERTRREGRQKSSLASQELHPLRCMQKRDSVSVPLTSASLRKTERPFQAQSVSHRTDKTSLELKRTPRDFPRRLFLYPVPSAAARTAPNGVKERASFCLVFRSLNTTSSLRMFSIGYRRAKSTQGNTNFQKRIFLANNFGITTRGP